MDALYDRVRVQAEGIEECAVILTQLFEAFAREEQRAGLGRIASEQALHGQ